MVIGPAEKVNTFLHATPTEPTEPADEVADAEAVIQKTIVRLRSEVSGIPSKSPVKFSQPAG